MSACHCPSCSPDPLPTYSEAHRAACEARCVAAMDSDEQRTAYIEDVAMRRGTARAQQLRREAFKIMQDDDRRVRPCRG